MNNTVIQTNIEPMMGQINQLAHQLNGLGLNLLVFDDQPACLFQSQAGVFESDAEAIAQAVLQNETARESHWLTDTVISYPVCRDDQPVYTLAVDAGKPQNDQEKKYLALIVEDFAARLFDKEQMQSQIEKISTELSQAYEEIMLMYNLSTNMKVTQTNSNYLQMACDQLTQLVPVEGIAIFLEKKTDGLKELSLVAGSGVMTIDMAAADILQMHLMSELNAGHDALLDSEEDGPFKYNWSQGVKSLIAVPLANEDRSLGFLVATNIKNKPDFNTIDVKLFNSVANQCMVFIENNHLFDDLKDLFIGSLKALTSSIDAKDQYTRGHSERVAFISRWIAEHMAKTHPISEKQIHHIYLAGLLHDIGKIGVSEAVLCKNGKLTDEEWATIQAHPRIGASILSDIRQMEEIVPGVIGHHERMDGKGYPNGLAGDEISLVAKIISIADSFDAMTSKRVYRDAMSIQRALREIERGIGTQFDEEVARTFLDSDIDKLWRIIQDGFIERWDYSNFEEYGAEAVGALLR
ncbi:MAG: HD domain-containing phosphohydrolase [Planctomycetota bacterium]|jgi:HD-GYP domain-containing protein (c-di-GMP phosphodiesterase class II)